MMNKAKRGIALLLAVLLLASQDSYLVQVLAENIAGATFAIDMGVAEGVGDDAVFKDSAVVNTGDSFAYRVNYNYSSSGGTQNVEGAQLLITYPDYLTPKTLANGQMAAGTYVLATEVAAMKGGYNLLTVNMSQQETGQAANVTIYFDTPNYELPDETIIKDGADGSDKITPEFSYYLEGVQYTGVYAQSPTVSLQANDSWSVNKRPTVNPTENEDGLSVGDGVLVGDSFRGSFEIKVSSNYENIDSPGQRAVTDYELIDVINRDYLTGGEPIAIENVRMGNTVLNAGSDYIVQANVGVVESITFLTHETIPADGTYSRAGQMAPTTYTYDVVYEKDAYIFDINEEFAPQTVTNTVTLNYELLDTAMVPSDSTAGVSLGVVESDVPLGSLNILKKIRYNDELYDLTAENVARYGTGHIAFDVKTEDGAQAPDPTNPRQSIADQKLDSLGRATIKGLKAGAVYVLEELLPDHSNLATPPGKNAETKTAGIHIQIPNTGESLNADSMIDPNGYEVSIDETTNTLVIINNITNIGGVEFTKQGRAADGSAQMLSGVEFTLVNQDADAAVPSVKATSQNGQVSFTNLPAGTYDLYETKLDPTQPGLADYAAIAGDSGELTPIARDIVVTEGAITRPLWEGETTYWNISDKGYFELTKVNAEGRAIVSASADKAAQFKLYGPLSVAEAALYQDADDLRAISGDILAGWEVQDLTPKSLADGTYKLAAPTAAGVYILQETKAPFGYKIMEPGLTRVEIEANSTNRDLAVVNTSLQPVRFLKYGLNDGQRIEGLDYFRGIQFEIYKAKTLNPSDPADYEKIDTVSIERSEDGQAVSSLALSPNLYLEAGVTYYYKEIIPAALQADYPFVPQTGLIPFTVGSGAGTIFTVSVENASNAGRLRIIKTDRETGKPLAGATYNVYRATSGETKGDLVAESLSTAADGTITTGLLPAGAYIVEEVSAPAGYAPAVQAENDQLVTVAVDETADVTFANDKYYDLQLIKLDQEGQPLANAVFTVKPAGNGSSQPLTADSTGGNVFTYREVLKGASYTITETAPENYVGVDEFTVEIGETSGSAGDAVYSVFADGVQKVYVTNQRQAAVAVTKVHNFDNGDTYTPYTAAAVEFTLYTWDGEAFVEVETKRTATGNGSLTFTGLEPGQVYYLKEAAVTGYEFFKADNEADSDYPLVTAANTPAGADYDGEKYIRLPALAAGTTTAVRAYNRATHSQLLIKKQSQGEGEPTALRGVNFKLYLVDGSERTPVGPSAGVNTAANGEIAATAFGWLAPGSYVLVETVPDGYYALVDGTYIGAGKTAEYPFTVDTANQGTILRQFYTTPIVNYREGTLKINKFGRFENAADETDFYRYALTGAKFDLYAHDDAAADKLGAKIKEIDMGSLSSKSETLAPGRYVLIETEAPEGYLKHSGPIFVTVAAGAVTTTDVDNRPDGLGLIELTKTDPDGNPITGDHAEFEIYLQITADEYREGDSDHIALARGSGTIYLQKTPVSQSGLTGPENPDATVLVTRNGVGYTIPVVIGGVYYFKEIKAPDGYELIEEWSGPVTVAEGKNNLRVPNRPVVGEGEGDREYAYLQVAKATVIGGVEKPVNGIKYYVYATGNTDENGRPESFDVTDTEQFRLVAVGFTNSNDGDGVYISAPLAADQWYIVREAGSDEYFGQSTQALELVDVDDPQVTIGDGPKQDQDWAPIWVGAGTTSNFPVYPADESAAVTFYNEPLVGTFALHKKVLGETDENAAFTFDLYRQLKPAEATEANKPAADDENWELVSENLSVKNQETIISALYSTKYVYKLVEKPLAAGSDYYFEAAGLNTLARIFYLENGQVTGFDAGEYQAFASEAAAVAAPITYTNKKKVTIDLHKDGDWIDGAGEKSAYQLSGASAPGLPGVTFKLYTDAAYEQEADYAAIILNYHESQVVKTDGVITALLTDANGNISLKVKPNSESADGKYFIKEVAVDTAASRLNSLNGFDVGADGIELGPIGGTNGESDTKTYGNESRYGRFKTQKVDGNAAATMLAGAQFRVHVEIPGGEPQVYRDGQDKEMLLTSASNGTIMSGPLPAGTYYLEELKTPGITDEYAADDASLSGPFTVTALDLTDYIDGPDVQPIKNWKNFRIQVVKKGEVPSLQLNGAIFDLYDNLADAQQQNPQARLASGETARVGGRDGILVFDRLLNLKAADGNTHTYYLVETRAPLGYVRNEEPVAVTVSYEQIKTPGVIGLVTREVTNIKGPTLRLHKVGNLIGHADGLPGVTFTLEEITGLNADGEVQVSGSQTGQTDGDGFVAFDRLSEAILKDNTWYRLRETAVPAEYESNFNAAEAPYYYLKAENGAIVETYYTGIAADDEQNLVGTGAASTASITNKATLAQLRVEKKDGNAELDAAGQTSYLTSAWFAIYKKVGDDTYLPYTRANFAKDGAPEQAYFQVTNGELEADFYLAAGDYALVELGDDTAALERLDATYPGVSAMAAGLRTAGQELTPYAKVSADDGKEYTVQFQAADTALSFAVTPADLPAHETDLKMKTVTAYNEPLGNLTVTKYGDTDNSGDISAADERLQGVRFKLNGRGYESSGRTTNDEGQVIFADLPAGRYDLTETNGVSHYELMEPNPLGDIAVGEIAGRAVTLKEFAANPGLLYRSVEVLNPSASGLLQIIKTDENGRPLTIAAGDKLVFEIYTLAGVKVDTVTIDTQDKSTNGVFSKPLPAAAGGTGYKLKEVWTKAGYVLPEGYVKDAAGQELVIILFPNQSETALRSQKTAPEINTARLTNTYYDRDDDYNPKIFKQVQLTGTAGWAASVQADTNLVDEPDGVAVTFRVDGFADGGNRYDLEDFTVTDGVFARGKTGGIIFRDAGGDPIDFTAGADDEIRDYELRTLHLTPARNGDGSYAGAEIYVQTSYQAYDTEEFTLYQMVQSLNAATVITLPAHTTAVQVRYTDTRKGFETEGYDLTAVLNYRGDWDPEILKTLHAVMKVENTAQVRYREKVYYQVDEAGQPVYAPAKERESVSDPVTVVFSEPAAVFPEISLKNDIVKKKNTYYGGDKIDYRITATNNSSRAEEILHQPIISFAMPYDTTLITQDATNYGLTVAVWNADGTLAGTLIQDTHYAVVANTETTDGAVIPAVVGVAEGQYQEKPGSATTQYNLVFDKSGDNAVSLAPGQYITVDFSGRISYDTKQASDNLVLVSYLGSKTTILPDAANPYGTSFKSYFATTHPVAYEEVPGYGSGKELEFINTYVVATVENSNSMAVTKAIGKSEEDLAGNRQSIQVEENGDIYYKLTIYNNSQDNMQTARLVDILPYAGDTMILSGSSRGTSIGSPSDTVDKVDLVSVTVADQTKLGKSVAETIYYYREDSRLDNTWAGDDRNAQTAGGRLGMLFHNDGEWPANWTTDLQTGNEDLVSAVGAEIAFPQGFVSGDSVEVIVHVKAPAFDETQLELFKEKLISNSVAGALVPANAASGGTISNGLRSEPDPVHAELVLPRASLGDTIFRDNDLNGSYGDGDEPIEEAVVHLWQKRYYKTNTDETIKSDTNYLGFTRTAADGTYEFANLAASELKYAASANTYSTDPSDYIGNQYYAYYIQVDPVAGLTSTRQQVGNTAGQSGFAYLNEAQTEDDSDLNAALITPEAILYLTKDRVRDEAEAKLRGEHRADLDGGLAVAYALGNYVWEDRNADGVQQEGEDGVAGVRVNLYRVTGETAEAVPLLRTNTDADGYYEFTDLTAGDYVVEFDTTNHLHDPLPNGETPYLYAFTTANAGMDAALDSDARDEVRADGRVARTAVISLNEEALADIGTTDNRWDAGLVRYSALGGYAFDDRDYDDLQAPGMAMFPLAGTTVRLYELNGSELGAKIGETTVDENGYYYFDKLFMAGAAQDYTILFTLPDGYELVLPNRDSDTGTTESTAGADSVIDSDAVNSGPTIRDTRITKITLDKGTISTTWSVGARKYSTIGDYVWVDANRNGYQDESESGVAGVMVALQEREHTRAAWVTRARTLTDADGRYEFDRLPSSDQLTREYRVVFMLAENIKITSQNVTSRLVEQADGSQREAAVNTEQDSDAAGQFLGTVVDGESGGYTTMKIKPGYGQSDRSWDAGIYYGQAAIRGLTWHDADFNGRQDRGEAMIARVLVTLEFNESGRVNEESAWTAVAAMTTGVDGLYSFTELTPGYYRLMFTFPEGYTATRYNYLQGAGEEKLDSDASRRTVDPQVFYSKHVFLEEGQVVDDIDAGIYDPKTYINRIPEEDVTHRSVKRYVPNYVRTARSTTRGSGRSGSAKTGDTSDLMLWILVMGTTGAVLITGNEKRKKAKKGDL